MELRKTKAHAVREGMAALESSAPELLAGPLHPSRSGVAARAVLEGFVAAVEARNFAAALALLAHPWRSRYSSETLARDFRRDPLAGERLERARHASQGRGRAIVRGSLSGFEFRIDANRAAVVMDEGGTFRVSALE